MKKAIKLLIRILRWGSKRGHVADVFGDDLAQDIIIFLSLSAPKQWLIENGDYWESVNEPIPDPVLAKMRKVPELLDLVAWVDENGNGVW